MEKYIFEYIKDKHGHRLGVICAVTRKKVGWSLCKVGIDSFDREQGLAIALGRAEKGSDTPIPISIREQYSRFEERAKEYFKKK